DSLQVVAYTPSLSDSKPTTLAQLYLSAHTLYPDEIKNPEVAQKLHPTAHPSFFVYDPKKKPYKPVAKKVKAQLADLPDKFHIKRQIVGDPLANMPALDPNPPPFTPTGRYTEERKNIMDDMHPDDFLWEEERRLMHDFMCKQNEGFAWTEAEKG